MKDKDSLFVQYQDTEDRDCLTMSTLFSSLTLPVHFPAPLTTKRTSIISKFMYGESKQLPQDGAKPKLLLIGAIVIFGVLFALSFHFQPDSGAPSQVVAPDHFISAT